MIDYNETFEAKITESKINTAKHFLKRQFSNGNIITLEQAIKIVADNLGYAKDITEWAYNAIQYESRNIDYEARTEARIQARVDETILKLAKNAVDNYSKAHKDKEYPEVIEWVTELLNLDEKTIATLKSEYTSV